MTRPLHASYRDRAHGPNRPEHHPPYHIARPSLVTPFAAPFVSAFVISFAASVAASVAALFAALFATSSATLFGPLLTASLALTAALPGKVGAAAPPVPAAEDLTRLGLHELVARLPRLGEADWEADPKTGRMVLLPQLSELRRRIESGVALDIDDWRTILVDKGYLRWRTKWPLGEPFAISLHLPALEQGLTVELVPRVTGWKRARASHWEMMCGLGTASLWEDEDYQVLGPLSSERRTIDFDILPDCRASDWNRNRTALRTVLGPIRIDVAPAPTLDEVLERRTDALPGRALLRSLRLQIQPDGEGPGRVWLTTDSGWPRSLAAIVQAQLAHGAREFPLTRLWMNELHRAPLARLEGLPVEVAKGRHSSDEWILRLRGLPDGVLRDWDATSYWAGQIEIPLRDLIRH